MARKKQNGWGKSKSLIFFFVLIGNMDYSLPALLWSLMKHWALRNSMRVNVFVNDIHSTHDSELRRSPCRTPPWVREYYFFSYIFVSCCCFLYIWILHCANAQLLEVAMFSSWELNFKDVSVLTARNKLFHGNENCTLHHKEEFKFSAEWSRFLGFTCSLKSVLSHRRDGRIPIQHCSLWCSD